MTAVTNLTRSAEAMPRAFEAGAMPVIASIILLALIVAAVGRGTLILARRLQALHDISAASLFALRFLHSLCYLRCLAGRPTKKQARWSTKKQTLTAAHKRQKI